LATMRASGFMPQLLSTICSGDGTCGTTWWIRSAICFGEFSGIAPDCCAAELRYAKLSSKI